MFTTIELLIAFLIAFISTFLLTYPVKRLAKKIGMIDHPNVRKIHKKPTPRLGGLAIFIGVCLGAFYLQPDHEHMFAILFGATIILITGILDDKFSIRPILKLTGQLMAATCLLSSGLIIEKMTLPFIGMIDLGFFSVIITLLWIVGITNAINLIDGLDGLATGITSIAFTSIFIMGLIDGQGVVIYLSLLFIGGNLGFFYHNYYPAKIYMGDAGSNLLGFMIATVSMLGLFKNIALFSFVIPVVVLAVPIFDTLFAIVRRIHNKESIMLADNKHIHYQLIKAGYTHRQTVFIMYAFSSLFGLMAVLLSAASITTSFIITLFVLILIHIFAELAGLVLEGKRPVINFIKRIFAKRRRNR